MCHKTTVDILDVAKGLPESSNCTTSPMLCLPMRNTINRRFSYATASYQYYLHIMPFPLHANLSIKLFTRHIFTSQVACFTMTTSTVVRKINHCECVLNCMIMTPSVAVPRLAWHQGQYSAHLCPVLWAGMTVRFVQCFALLLSELLQEKPTPSSNMG